MEPFGYCCGLRGALESKGLRTTALTEMSFSNRDACLCKTSAYLMIYLNIPGSNAELSVANEVLKKCSYAAER